MSTSGTWCDNIIMQAVANAMNCVIHITHSNINLTEPTIITPIVHQENQGILFIGYINGLHHVSTFSDRTNKNKNRLKYIKKKLLESKDQKQKRLAQAQLRYSNKKRKLSHIPVKINQEAKGAKKATEQQTTNPIQHTFNGAISTTCKKEH